MATTKKVARSLGSKTSRTSASLARTAVAKKTSAKTLKRKGRSAVASVSIKDNTVSKKANPKQRIEAKLSRVEALHTKQKQTQTLPQTGVLPALQKAKPALALALLSPYRFPINIDQVAHSTARFGGVFFVLIGAFFTLLFANSSFSGSLQSAALTESLVKTVDTTLSETITKPEVRFDINNRNELRNTVQVRVKVEHAQGVTLMAYSKTQGREVTFGRPANVSSDSWEMQLNTIAFDDGVYTLKALIQNQYGSYEAVDHEDVTIVNHPLKDNDSSGPSGSSDQSGTDASTNRANIVSEVASVLTGDDTTSQSATTTPSAATAASDVRLSSDKTEASEFRFEIAVKGADKVKLYAHEENKTVQTLLGYAYKADSSLWKFRWIPSGLSSGAYIVKAQVLDDSDEYTSNEVRVRLAASNDSTLSTVSKTAGTVITTVGSSTAQNTQQPITPNIFVKIQSESPLHGTVPILVEVQDALGVELYALPNGSLVQRYLGTARRIDTDAWSFVWDTTLVPNGDYKLYAYVKNAYGTYFKESSAGKVQNDISIAYTETQQKSIETLTGIGMQQEKLSIVSELPAPIVTETRQHVPEEPEPQADESAPEAVPVKENTQTTIVTRQNTAEELPDEDLEKVRNVLESYQDEINAELQRLASATRMKDAASVEKIKTRLNELKRTIATSRLDEADQTRLTNTINEYVDKAVVRVERDVEKMEKVITERTQEKAVTDADKDGISDYDEVNIYSTDPYSADSDNDGFQDGAEILNGYNPKDAVAEVPIAYESPKEAGIVREDILKIDAVLSAAKNEPTAETVPAAIISGKGLPNSFVTLYIFSTPIVVTLKTDTEGSWIYRFDKELEDGAHEVYVGVTDNAGKIVAKSQPFSFVKEAEAFTATDAAPVVEEVPTRSFASQYMVYLVLSISVVAIGLVLILLGLHLDATPKRKELELETKEAV